MARRTRSVLQPCCVERRSARPPTATATSAAAIHGSELSTPRARMWPIPSEASSVGSQDWRMKKFQLDWERGEQGGV